MAVRRSRKGERKVTALEQQRRRVAVLGAMRAGAPREAILALVDRPPVPERVDPETGKKHPGIPNPLYRVPRSAVLAFMREVAEEWEGDLKRDASTIRPQQLERIRGFIYRASQRERWGAVASLELTYAKIAGTLAPVNVRVDVHREFQAALYESSAALSEEELEELAEENARLEVTQVERVRVTRVAARLPAGGNGAR